ncbi:hypothetical protein SAMN05444394_1087 [Algoriphagus halophilus]|uniref:Uncharacterized protein n=2 Tax=Algoriphagus halophilus TaxID=226505 RepID=A0A1N6DL00_9BACT|nr:hypothetical protein SAMN05444394_1087 [Algoriphagus halophilus]
MFLLVFLVGTSCKTYHKVDWIKPNIPVEERSKYFEPRQLSRISEGDDLFVLTKDSVSYDITYSEVRNDSIQGLFTQKNNRRLKVPIETGVPISEIYILKVKRVNFWASFGAVATIPLFVWAYFQMNPIRIGFSGI